jgi:hypothetical protein
MPGMRIARRWDFSLAINPELPRKENASKTNGGGDFVAVTSLA